MASIHKYDLLKNMTKNIKMRDEDKMQNLPIDVPPIVVEVAHTKHEGEIQLDLAWPFLIQQSSETVLFCFALRTIGEGLHWILFSWIN